VFSAVGEEVVFFLTGDEECETFSFDRSKSNWFCSLFSRDSSLSLSIVFSRYAVFVCSC
jgi:hypothetical protein